MQNHKNRTGEVVMMSPDEYFRECAEKIFKISQKSLEEQRAANTGTIIEYTSAMKRGDVFPLPYINYADKSQEGLHRMMAAGDAFGWNTKFPVLVITPYDEEYEVQVNNYNRMREYERFDFKKVVVEAADILSEWDNMAPPDILTQLREQIVKCAKNPPDSDIEAADIDVDVECKAESNGIRIFVYLKTFDGVEEEHNAFSTVRLWLDDMFDLSESPFEAGDYY